MSVAGIGKSSSIIGLILEALLNGDAPVSTSTMPQSTKKFDAGPNSELSQWSDGIQKAADASGLDPNLIGGMIWAESRGNPDDPSTNRDGTSDLSLMQISQERWENDIVPNLSQEDREKIRKATGKEAEDLDMSDPNDNIIGGSFELKQRLKENGGDLRKALTYYQSGESDGDTTYADNVLQYMEELANGKVLSDDPFGSP